MLKLVTEGKFDKDISKYLRRKKDMQKLWDLVLLLTENKPLPPKNRNHKLHGEFGNYWECHIEPDWLLIYKKTSTEIILSRMGTHSDLF